MYVECVIYTKRLKRHISKITSEMSSFVKVSLYVSISKVVAGTVLLWLCRSHPGHSACNQRWACFLVCSSSRTS